ncbi:hypothetical protein LTR64_004179 [Lithohypha guttulata]|uniref:uncharacterized protein n=1 Tax=Lithohypha guttulata TaxID=1690604 RepID=UPI002DDE2C6E|nr:hypothetical protein LTR51_006527 [Lithohypha guttulata]
MGEPTVNGDMPHSAFLDHATGYPMVSDSIQAFQNNPYGQKSIDITNFTYANFVKPTFPYLEKPASYIKPYAAKVDELGDSLLTKIDERVPILQKETEEVKSTVIDYVNWPRKVAHEQVSYVYDTYNNEYKKCGGDGVVAGSKALVSGSFVITSDWLSYFATLLQKRKEEAQDVAQQAMGVAQEKFQQAKGTAQEKTQQAKGTAQEKSQQAKETAQDKSQQAKETAQEKSSN